MQPGEDGSLPRRPTVYFVMPSFGPALRRAREVVSTELWEVLNTTRARMPRKVASDKVHEFFAWVRERSALAVGILESASSRDEAWSFFTLGRSIERADMTARLLATRSLTEASGPSWTTILRSVGARPIHIFLLMVAEAGALSLGGAVLGVVLAYAVLAVAQPIIDQRFGLYLPLTGLGPSESLYLAVVVVAGLAAGALPALRAYFNSVADGVVVRI